MSYFIYYYIEWTTSVARTRDPAISQIPNPPGHILDNIFCCCFFSLLFGHCPILSIAYSPSIKLNGFYSFAGRRIFCMSLGLPGIVFWGCESQRTRVPRVTIAPSATFTPTGPATPPISVSQQHTVRARRDREADGSHFV